MYDKKKSILHEKHDRNTKNGSKFQDYMSFKDALMSSNTNLAHHCKGTKEGQKYLRRKDTYKKSKFEKSGGDYYL
jgi:hypothetical protein